jgi:hypothetical protein
VTGFWPEVLVYMIVSLIVIVLFLYILTQALTTVI